jgi:anti-sigma factor RsiW
MTAELVAYLDGELEGAASRAVEERLSRDPVYRRLLRELQQSWDLLEHLPQAEVGEAFTQSTVTMVAVVAADDAEKLRDRSQRRRRWAFWAGLAGSVAGLAAGYFGVAVLARRENRQVLRDLPVIERVDEYLYVDDIEFLRMLERQGVFSEAEVERDR